MQSYGDFRGFALQHAVVWVGNILTPPPLNDPVPSATKLASRRTETPKDPVARTDRGGTVSSVEKAQPSL